MRGSRRSGTDPGGGKWWQVRDRSRYAQQYPPPHFRAQTLVFFNYFWTVEVAWVGSTTFLIEGSSSESAFAEFGAGGRLTGGVAPLAVDGLAAGGFLWAINPGGPENDVKLIHAEPDIHDWQYPFPKRLEIRRLWFWIRDDSDDQRFIVKWLHTQWFFPNIHEYVHMNCEVLCLTIARWQRDWDHMWYSAGLVLEKLGNQMVQNEGGVGYMQSLKAHWLLWTRLGYGTWGLEEWWRGKGYSHSITYVSERVDSTFLQKEDNFCSAQ